MGKMSPLRQRMVKDASPVLTFRHRPHQRRGLRDIFHGSLRISKSNLLGFFNADPIRKFSKFP